LGSELVGRPCRSAHANDRHIKVAALRHGLYRWKDFLEGQITGGAKEDQGVGLGCTHRVLLLGDTLSYIVLMN
jgi:hypothetical protein